MDDTVTTLIAGAGLAGSALAMHLAESGDEAVLCVDPDLAGARSSSQRNAGGVRATWWREVNIDLCARSIAFFAEHADEFSFRRHGYLWLYGDDLWAGARAHTRLQNRYGLAVEELDAAQVQRRFPFVDASEGVAGATLSPMDGLIDPHAVREHYRRRARAAGATFLDRHALVEYEDARAGTGGLAGLRPVDGDAGAGAALGTGESGPPPGPVRRVRCGRVVNAAGPWAAPVAAVLGYRVPCRAVRRQISLARHEGVDLGGVGMIVDTSGLYLHGEGEGLMLAGYSPPGDPPGYDLRYEGEAFFEREIWPRAAARIPAFDRLAHVRGWAGLYELSPDNSALLGSVEGRPDVFEMHSFSGRGLMQSHAAGLALAELMTTGRFRTADASALSGSRFAAGALQREDLHI